MSYCEYPPSAYVFKFFNNTDGWEADLLHSRLNIRRADPEKGSTSFFALRSAVLAGGIASRETEPPSEIRTVTFVEPPALLNPKGNGTYSYGLLVPAVNMLSADARFLPAQTSVEESLEVWEDYGANPIGMALPFEGWKQQLLDSKWVIELCDQYADQTNYMYYDKPIEEEGYAWGIIVRTASEARVILQDILWLYDVGIRDPDYYAFIIPLDAIRSGTNIQPSEIIPNAAEKFNVDISDYLYPPGTKDDVEALEILIKETLSQFNNVTSLNKLLPASIPYLVFPDNRAPLCRSLVSEDRMIFTLDGEYLHPIPAFSDLSHPVKVVALDLLISKIKAKWRGPCNLQLRSEEAVSVIRQYF